MGTTSKKVFCEGSVFFAFIDRAHPKHDQAAAYFRFFAQEEYQIYTDNVSIIYIYEQIYKDISPSLAKDFLRTIALSHINVVYPDESDAKVALKALVNYQSVELTYHKALVAALAYRKNIPHVFTFDYLPNLFGLSVFYLPL